MNRIDPEQRIDDMQLLHPYARPNFARLEEALRFAHIDKKTPTLFLPFETYRTPHRQKMLFEKAKSTKAGPYKSPHQFGMAVDFVAHTENGWSWGENHDWDFLRDEAAKFGLHTPIKWDRVHVEHPRWQWIIDAVRY